MTSTPAAQSTGAPKVAAANGRIPHLPGLDGLRAVAVIAVVLYHTELAWFSGGFLGVDVFFVISGYLITLLLLAEWQAQRSVDLQGFWLRRARRLLPAVYVAIVAIVTFSVVFLPNEVASLRSDAVASFAYVTNWYLIFSQQSYFQAAARPSMLRHLWSLAVEEQFYLVWPVLFLVGMRLFSHRRMFVLTLTAAAASVVLMAALFDPSADPSRVYYGTDARAFPLLLGAALAFVWAPGNLPRPSGAVGVRLVNGIGVAALLALTACFVWLDAYTPILYRGGFLMVALIAIVLVATTVHPASALGAGLLSWMPLQWIGQRSYSIYLWHWPVFDLTRPSLDLPIDGLTALLIRVPLTLLAAEVSYRFVETPFRKGALGQAWAALRASSGIQRRALGLRWALSAAALAISASLVTAAAVAAQQPSPPSYLSISDINTVGRTATPTAPATASADKPVESPPAEGTPTPENGAPAAATPVSTGTPAPVPEASATPEDDLMPPHRPARLPTVTPEVIVHRVLAIGDSVMLGAAPQLQAAIPDLALDASQGRQSWSAAGVLSAHLQAGRVGTVVVIHLGHNYIFTAQQVDDIMAVLGSNRRVFFVNLKLPRDWEGPSNTTLSNAPKKYPNVVVVDWHAASVKHPEYFWDDGIHLRPEGAEVYARLIAAAIAAADGSPGTSGKQEAATPPPAP